MLSADIQVQIVMILLHIANQKFIIIRITEVRTAYWAVRSVGIRYYGRDEDKEGTQKKQQVC